MDSHLELKITLLKYVQNNKDGALKYIYGKVSASQLLSQPQQMYTIRIIVIPILQIKRLRVRDIVIVTMKAQTQTQICV